MRDFFVLAFKNLKHRGIRSWLTLLGIFIGVMAVVSLISLGNGLQAAVGAQFGIGSTEMITIQAGGLQAGMPGTGVSDPLTTDDAVAIGKLSTVKASIPRTMTSAKIEYNDEVSYDIVASIPDGDDRKLVYELIDIAPAEGRMLKDGDSNKVILGWDFYKDDSIFGKRVEVGKSIFVNDKKFTVVGIMEKKGSYILDQIILMNDEAMRDLFEYGEEADIIVAQVKDKDLMERTKEDIEKLLRKRRDVDVGKEDFEVSTPDAMLDSVNSVLGGVQAFIIVIASISIFVGAVGIVNTMTTSVMERRKEIGIMKAIGAKNSQIFMQFLIESGLLGLAGGMFGCLVGMAVGAVGILAINNLIGGEIRPGIDFVLIGGSLVGSFLIGAIAGIVPAMNAAKQNPVEVLRG